MTTETTKPRTLEEIAAAAWSAAHNGDTYLPVPEWLIVALREAASRASPEAACAGCGGCGDGRSWADVERVLNDLNVSQDPAVRGVVQMIRARLPRPGCPGGHRSDCAVHNEPAMPNGPCDCGRASPEEGRAAEVDEAIDNFESAVRDNERGTDPHVPPMAVSILRNALRMIALGSRPAVDHTGRQPTNDRPHYLTKPWAPPPEDSGAREEADPTLYRAPPARDVPTVPTLPHDDRRCFHGIYQPGCADCERQLVARSRAPASSKEGGR